MKRKTIFLILALCCLFTGCRKETLPPQSHIVTKVTVSYNGEVLGEYHTEEKIQGMLVYLRGLELPRLYFGKRQPELPLRHVFTLDLTFADGHTKRYQQANHRYVRLESGPWKELSTERCAELYHVLLAYPLDVSQQPAFHSLAVDLPHKPWYNNGKFAFPGGVYESSDHPRGLSSCAGQLRSAAGHCPYKRDFSA